ncbi:MAG: hypothetical protein QF605_03925, partial [Rhodospirillales bacterium]|nr:hypothetical protein [Rhodospirillales bacterium]
MTIAYFQTLNVTAESGPEIRQNFREHAVPVLLERPEIDCVSVYAPELVEDPYVNDGPPPELVVQFNVADLEALELVFNDQDVVPILAAPENATASAEVFEIIAYDIESVAEPEKRTAPLSFNVRYYAPVTDEQHFVDFYLAHHPQILADLPGIRNVFCYVPVVVGSDAGSHGVVHGEAVIDEIRFLVDAGMSMAKVLNATTALPRHLWGSPSADIKPG